MLIPLLVSGVESNVNVMIVFMLFRVGYVLRVVRVVSVLRVIIVIGAVAVLNLMLCLTVVVFVF